MAENETSSCMKPREKSTRSQAEVYLPPLKRSRSKCQVSAPQPSNSSLQLSQCISESVPRRSRTRCRTTSDTTIEEDSMIALSDPKNHNFMQNKNTASGSRNKSTSQMGRSQSKASDDVIISEVSPIVTRRSRSRSHVSSLMENPPPLTRSRSIPQKATTIPTTRSRSRGRFELSGNSGAEIRIERNLPRPVEQSSSRHGQSQSEAIIVSEVSSRRSRSRCRVASLKETPPSLSTTRSKPIQQEKSIRHPRSRSRSRVVLSENSCAEIIKKRNPPRSKSVVGRPQSNNEDEKKKNQKVPTRVRSKSVSYEISKLVRFDLNICKNIHPYNFRYQTGMFHEYRLIFTRCKFCGLRFRKRQLLLNFQSTNRAFKNCWLDGCLVWNQSFNCFQLFQLNYTKRTRSCTASSVRLLEQWVFYLPALAF